MKYSPCTASLSSCRAITTTELLTDCLNTAMRGPCTREASPYVAMDLPLAGWFVLVSMIALLILSMAIL